MAMPYYVKRNIVAKKLACFFCLKINNLSRNYRAKVKCVVCRKKSQNCCIPKVTEKLSKPGIPESDSLKKEDDMLASQASNKNGGILLQTLMVRLKN